MASPVEIFDLLAAQYRDLFRKYATNSLEDAAKALQLSDDLSPGQDAQIFVLYWELMHRAYEEKYGKPEGNPVPGTGKAGRPQYGNKRFRWNGDGFRRT